MTESIQDQHQLVINCWYAGVDAVRGETATRIALASDDVKDIRYLLAVGKAASSMCLGALDKLTDDAHALVITKYEHVDQHVATDARFECIESGHPIPDENSLRAGESACRFVESVPDSEDLVMLVSGGASALVEHLPGSVTLDDLQRLNEVLISESFDIEKINAVRNRFSLIKGGKLLQRFKGRKVLVYAISDVPGDDVYTIGSGIGGPGRDLAIGFRIPSEVEELMSHLKEAVPLVPLPREKYQAEIIASNNTARYAAADFAHDLGLDIVVNVHALDQDYLSAAAMIVTQLREGPKGVYIWGGEPTVTLPENPGRGGRNQSLGLAIARGISGMDNITVVIAGTDGTDGPTDAAGAVVDGVTYTAADGADQALEAADAGSFLEMVGALFKSGPTGTNVMDLVVACKGAR